jgi:hypothetical protein
MSQQVTEPPLTSFQISLRARTDVRNPPQGLVAALSGQFEQAASRAHGRICLSVPGASPGDDSRQAAEAVLRAAAAHREASTGIPVAVQVSETWYTGDGYCHVLAQCEIPPVAPNRNSQGPIPEPEAS